MKHVICATFVFQVFFDDTEYFFVNNHTTQNTTSATTTHATQETNDEEGSGTGINDRSTKRSTTTFFAENPDVEKDVEIKQKTSSTTLTPGSENTDNKTFKLHRTNGSIENRTKVNLGEYSTVSNSAAIEEQGFEMPKDDTKGSQNGIEKDSHMINGTIHKKDEDNEQMEKDNNLTTQNTTSETSLHTTKETNEEEGSPTGVNGKSTKKSTTPFLNENSVIGE